MGNESPPPELCEFCDEPTGRAGIHDDSIFIEVNGTLQIGPLCESCHGEIRQVDLDEQIDQLRADKAELLIGLVECAGLSVGFYTAGACELAEDDESTPAQKEAVLKWKAIIDRANDLITKHTPTPPIVQELEKADELDAEEDVLQSNLESCDAGKVEPVVELPMLRKLTVFPVDYAKNPPTLTGFEFNSEEVPLELREQLYGVGLAPQMFDWVVDCWCTELPAEPMLGKPSATWELDHFIILEPVFDDLAVDKAVSNLLNDWLVERVNLEPVEHHDPADDAWDNTTESE